MLTPVLKMVMKQKSTLLMSIKQIPYVKNNNSFLLDEYTFNDGLFFDRFCRSLGTTDHIVSTPAYIKKHPWIYPKVSTVLQPTPCLGYVHPDIYHMLPNFIDTKVGRVFLILDSGCALTMLPKVSRVNITYEHNTPSKRRIPVSSTFIKKILKRKEALQLLHIANNALDMRTVDAPLKYLTDNRLQKLLRNDLRTRRLNFLRELK